MTTCKRCQTKNLYWQETDEGWRLFDNSGKHSCATQFTSKPSKGCRIGVQLTPLTYKSLEDYCQETGEDKQTVVENALIMHFLDLSK